VYGVRAALLIVAGLELGGCARDALVTPLGETRSGAWYIARQVDRISDAELPSSTLFSLASNSNYDWPRVSSMQLTCFEAKPLIRFAFDVKIGSSRNTALAYRFDDRPGHEDVESRVVRNNQIIVIEDAGAVATFVSEMTGARTLYVRLRSINGGRTAVEYPLAGSAAAMRAAFGTCKMPPPPLPEQERSTLSGIY
jgi:hypothetical protein